MRIVVDSLGLLLLAFMIGFTVTTLLLLAFKK